MIIFESKQEMLIVEYVAAERLKHGSMYVIGIYSPRICRIACCYEYHNSPLFVKTAECYNSFQRFQKKDFMI